MTPAAPWRFDDALAKEVVAAAGTCLDAPLDELGLALHRWIPSGSTAKAAAVAEGQLPPGLEPAAVAEQLLAGSRHSWTCWPAATITAAVLVARGHDAEVVGELRTDPAAPPVDVHAVVVVDGVHHLDPCLGPGIALDLAGDTRGSPSGFGELVPLDDHRWQHLSHGAGSGRNHYVTLGRHLGRREVRTFLEISVTHSGVPVSRRFYRRALHDGAVAVADHERGARLRRWQREGEGWVLGLERHGAFDELLATLP